MKGKRLIGILTVLIMFIFACSAPLVSFATVFANDGDIEMCPGNTRAYIKSDKYNYAWIDSVIMRDGSRSALPLALHPVTDYPYRLTCDEFIDECNEYMLLYKASDSAVQKTVMDTLKTVYYTLVATGKVTESNQDMRAYNESCGIVYPYSESQFTDIYTLITYVCLNNNVYKVISGEDLEIARGTTVEGAVVRYLSAVCGMDVPSEVDSIAAFSYLFTKKYVVEEQNYPVSENASEEEIYYWVKLQAAQKAGYNVPATTRYDDLSNEQIEYVTYAYYASLLKTRYEVYIDPMRLKTAILSSNPSEKTPRLVLESMLEHVSVSYSKNDSMEKLFKEAAKEGFFELENEFYTDIFDYNVYIPSNCDKVWITCIPIADQLENGNNDKVSINVNGVPVKNNSSTCVNIPVEGTTFTVKTSYEGKSDKATYSFTVARTENAANLNEIPSISISQPLNNLSSSISGYIGKAAHESPVYPYESPIQRYPSDTAPLTTYGIYDNNDSATTGPSFGTYPFDDSGNVLTTRSLLETSQENQTNISVLGNNPSGTVKNRPVAAIVAASAGFIALCALAGFIFYNRRKKK